MTEDETLAIPAAPRRPLVEWLPTGRTRERAQLFGAFAGGLLLGALVAAAFVSDGSRFLRR